MTGPPDADAGLPLHRWFQQPWPEGEYRFVQLGFVVDDVVSAARRWVEVHGVGPFHVLPPRSTPCTYRGEPSTLDLQLAVAQAGPVQIELIQQRDDRPSVFRELAASGGGSFHQVCTVTHEYRASLEHHARLGFEIACEIPGGAGAPSVAYIDTLAEFGFFTEVVEATRGFLDQLAAIDRAGATWDGTDPVRLVRRGGYDPV